MEKNYNDHKEKRDSEVNENTLKNIINKLILISVNLIYQ